MEKCEGAAVKVELDAIERGPVDKTDGGGVRSDESPEVVPGA